LKASAAVIAGVKIVTVAVPVLGGLVVLYFADPSQCRLFPPCPIHVATGLYCSGCGATRALHCLLHGDVSGAMAKNPLVVVALPFIVLLCLRPSLAQKPALPIVILAILLAYAVLRNIPLYPFVLLAPH
jgi:hypothetical protein